MGWRVRLEFFPQGWGCLIVVRSTQKNRDSGIAIDASMNNYPPPEQFKTNISISYN